ncbi:hypothetical protein [Amycolatopsis benzoatilytica]|uniref:hypothetical protein n=1 Tax=Amycolatopsis benzoatilytica TaxID=346045 RepID=UPI001FE2082B|nr:hypothetical protein [Amycolatopsis benzoatilytica]
MRNEFGIFLMVRALRDLPGEVTGIHSNGQCGALMLVLVHEHFLFGDAEFAVLAAES